MRRKITRRRFLGEASCAAVGSASLFSTLLNMKMVNAIAKHDAMTADNGIALNETAEGEADDYKALICLFLAGGNDSFNMLVPTGSAEYAEYKTVRSDLALSQATLLPLKDSATDGRTFGVHPSMPEVQQLYNNDNLAFVANVGTLVEPTTKQGFESGAANLPVGLFSHIDQIAHWQTSVPDKRTSIGWGGRTADLLKSLNTNQDISMNISLSGTNTFQAGTTMVDYAIEPHGNGSLGIHGFDYPRGALDVLKKSALESMLDLEYRNLFEQTFVNTTRTALNNHTQFSSAIASIPTFTTQFSPNPISQSFQMVAKTIAARQSLGFKRQTFFILFGGWDHHDEVLNNQLAMLSVISKGLREFYDVLVELGVQNKVTTFTASDFGRTLSSNGRGSDHAWGGNHMVMGGDVKGGQIYGNYPNLYVDNPLDVGRGSLIPTISCDEYFAELADWFGVARSDLSSVFPNIGRFYDTSARNLPVGFMNRHTVPSDTPSTTPTPTATPLPGTVQTPEPTEVPKPEEPLELPDKTHLPLIKNASGPLFPTTTGIIALTAGAVALRKRRTNG
ncbi:DUF1501 domain-containing protein [Chloroflexi bacterium TSY]|nr:DUF1501 domain-containing protein [Chloroflexi bacterium TSY]